ncbi:hypothetical protein V9T40_003039 [Parthenolecanium corni]|uniref:Uncharacterized protein n=1 Tax=Parthenolecanium corni TaxID=536013 RepID=A0AAN9TUK9_9HEMI
MEDCAERRTRPKIKNQHQKQKRRRDQVKSIIAAYVSGKVPLSKMMNPSRLTAPKNRNFESDIRKADRSADLPKASRGAANSRHKRKIGVNNASTNSNLVEQKEVIAECQELKKQWPAVQSKDQHANSLVTSCKDDGEVGVQDVQMCSTCSKTFISDTCSIKASTASSTKSLPLKAKSEAVSTFEKTTTASFEVPVAAATPASTTSRSEEVSQQDSTPRKQTAPVTGSWGQSSPNLFDMYPFDYDSFACYLTKKCSQSRHSAGPSLRWRTTSANFTKRQNLLELIKSHENVEQCLVKQIIHLRKERDKYRHAYIDLVKIHRILANRWFQFKKLNID